MTRRMQSDSDGSFLKDLGSGEVYADVPEMLRTILENKKTP
ncbi:hypothetical protein D2E23_0203 [Bifidobacterium callimiconis]|uniref:Uncharacterized protein n=1 Tax=Bifidobacterium callimiconis TaxID=2306973 RepID=A0A430FHU9_9BIFI|nr:hypothetical protein D2E23_0203 [Bifidobacterium callimiconis]